MPMRMNGRVIKIYSITPFIERVALSKEYKVLMCFTLSCVYNGHHTFVC